MRCALLDNMLFQFEMAALLGDSDTGGERRGTRKSGRQSERGGADGGGDEKKKAKGKTVVWNIC